MEAAKLYKQGWADEVWITQSQRFKGEIEYKKLGIHATSDSEYSEMVLERLGVPDSAIRVLPGRIFNTAQEVELIAGEMERVHGDRIILVSSSYHTRRVKVLWRRKTGGQPPAIVRYTRDEPFEPNAWWRDSTDAMAVLHEWFGLVNVWAGFPVRSEH